MTDRNRRHAGPRPHLSVTLLVVASVSLSGCLGGPGADSGSTAATTGDLWTVSMAPIDDPYTEEMLVFVTVDHIGLYDVDSAQWVPVLTDPADLMLVVGDGFGDPVEVSTLALVAGTYTDVEVVVSAASVLTETANTTATVDPVVCFAPIELGAAGTGMTLATTLLLSVTDALTGQQGGYTFRPAVVGTVGEGDDDGGDAAFGTPDCVPYA